MWLKGSYTTLASCSLIIKSPRLKKGITLPAGEERRGRFK